MSFIKFRQQGKRDSNFVSLTNSKSFGFGADFIAENALQSKKYVELFFEPESDKIAFKFVDEKVDNAFTLISPDNTQSKSIVARSFYNVNLKHVDLENYENKYLPEVMDNPDFGRLYVIKLKQKETDPKNLITVI